MYAEKHFPTLNLEGPVTGWAEDGEMRWSNDVVNNPDTSMVGKKPWRITDSSDGSIRYYWKRLSPAIGGGMLSSKSDKSRVSLREHSGRCDGLPAALVATASSSGHRHPI